ncbi:hypothetical protein BC832DRAFT_540112 [Gaertneriomyces semiglobifer]|nr:hypothetical protein BC832DRAFT_540112 [Gaertneriomyces semiglobifer]
MALETLSLEQLETAHAQHVSDPGNEGIRAHFLELACRYFLENPECMFHKNPRIAVELLELLSLEDTENEMIQSLYTKMAHQLAACGSCIDTYHEAKDIFYGRYIDVYGEAGLVAFSKRLFAWDVDRQRERLAAFKAEADSLPTLSGPEFKRFRRTTLFVMYEILRYPDTLQDERVDEYWTIVFKIIQSSSPLELRDQNFLPGAMIALLHRDDDVRRWAHRALAMPGLKLLWSAQIKSLFADVLRLTHPTRLPRLRYSYTSSVPERWRGTKLLLSILDDPTHFERLEVEVALSLLESIMNRLPHASNEFADLIECLLIVLRRPTQLHRLRKVDERLSLCEMIMEHPNMRSALMDDTFIRAHPAFLQWMVPILCDISVDIDRSWKDSVVKEYIRQSTKWCETAAELFTRVAFRMLQAETSHDRPVFSADSRKAIAEYLLTALSPDTPMFSRLATLVRAFIRQDADGLAMLDLGVRLMAATSTNLSERAARTQVEDWTAGISTVSCILDAAVRWAKAGQCASAEVRSLVTEALKLLKAVLSREVGPLTDGSEAVVKLRVCILCVLKWVATLDGEIRTAAFRQCYELARLIWTAGASCGTDATAFMTALASGQRKSLLSDEQREHLGRWATEDPRIPKGQPLPPRPPDHVFAPPTEAIGTGNTAVLSNGSNVTEVQASTGGSRGSTISSSSMSTTQSTRTPGRFLDAFVSTTGAKTAWDRLAEAALTKPLPSSKITLALSKNVPKLNKRPPAAGMSKLQKIAAEVAQESKAKAAANNVIKAGSSAKRNTPTLPLRLPESSVGGMELNDVVIIPRDEQPKADDGPRRTQLIDIPYTNAKAANKPVGKPIAVPGQARSVRSIKDLWKAVLSWTYDMQGDKPPGFKAELKRVPSRFDNVEEYWTVFEPLLILECWEQLNKGKEESSEAEAVAAVLDNVQGVDEFHDLTYVSPAKDVRLRGLGDHDVLHTTVGGKPGASGTTNFLAKIENIGYKGDDAYIKVRIFIGSRHNIVPELRIKSQWHMRRLFSLTTTYREYMSLIGVSDVPLMKDILEARSGKMPARPIEVRDIITKFALNEPQAAAISGALHQPSGFSLIQGPPGTGKTKTILGLIGMFLTSAKAKTGHVISVPTVAGRGVADRRPPPTTNKARLLCCAPSNAAVDEIVRRLKHGVNDLRGGMYTPVMVRLGNVDTIHPDGRDVSLDNLVDAALNKNPKFRSLNQSGDNEENTPEQIRLQMASLKDERETLRALEASDGLEASDVRDIQEKISAVTKKLSSLHGKLAADKQNRTSATMARDNIKRMTRAKLLQEADVILCTLSGAAHEVLSEVQGLEFPIVIIDEAGQCVESSTLIPLKHKAKKCILVGDPQQLPPTVLSKLGQEYGYEQSLFERIMTNYPQSVHLLSIQYRMHPDISVFPSKCFYGGKLLDAPNMKQLCAAPWHESRSFPAYMLYDVYRGQEQTGRGHSLFNLEEARLCVQLVEELCSRYSGYKFGGKIGVISFYKLQIRKIKDEFIRRFSHEIFNYVDVNTVDGFQGQEKEIIILSCVRANETGSVGFVSDARRMNVALTRSKHSLFVLGNVRSLTSNKLWRQLVDDADARRMCSKIDTSYFRPQSQIPQNIFKPSVERNGYTAPAQNSYASNSRKRPREANLPQGNDRQRQRPNFPRR